MDQEVLAVSPDLSQMRRRLLWLAGLWLLVVLAVSAWLTQWRLQSFRQAAVSGSTARLNSLQDNIENHFRSLAALGQVLARQPHYAEFLRQDLGPEPSRVSDAKRLQWRQQLQARAHVIAMSTQLDKLAEDFQIRQAYVLDAYGTVVADSAYLDQASSLIGANLRTTDYFVQGMAAGKGFQFVMGKISRKPGFNIASRIDDGPRSQGLLILKTDPVSMARMFTDTTGRILNLVDANGVVVASNKAPLLVRRVPDAPALAGREREIAQTYGQTPSDLNWQGLSLDAGAQRLVAMEIDQQRYLLQTRVLQGYPYTLWVLSPLAGENDIWLAATLQGATALLAGWLALWAYVRRLERQEAVEQVRRETLDMTRALPLTLFRYRVSPSGRGRFSYIGPGARQLFGVDEATLASHPQALWARCGLQDDKPPTQASEFAAEIDGLQRWVSINSAVATAPDGGQIYDGYWLDVTSRRQAEWRFEAAFTHAPGAQFFFHRTKGIQRCNPATLRLFGASHTSQLQGQVPWTPPLSPPRQSASLSSSDAALSLMQRVGQAQHEPVKSEWHHLRLDGTPIDCELTLIWLGHEDDGLYFAIIEDVSARKQTEDALRTARDAARETTRAKSAFLANMSHEIRTPMNAIIGMTHLALGDGTPDRLRSYVGKAHQAANSLLQIVNDILDMSKIEAGHLELECIEFPLQDVLDQLANVLGLTAEQKGLELLFTLSPDLPSHLMGDPTRLRQILVNLGANAIKFSDQGSVTIGLDVQHRHGDALVLHGWVRDTGIGMSAAQQQRLFQPFSQVDASTTRRYGGTGLGLTISQQLAELMHGRIWVDSQLNEGSTFHFTVRVGLPARAHTVGMLKEVWQGKHLLLVDDNADAREVLGQMAANLGLRVDFASSGQQALSQIERTARPYDWILLDWKMPQMDGIDCAARIHALMRTRFPQDSLCILLVTAFNREDALKAASGVALADVLTKPVTPSSLFDSLSKVSQMVPAPAPASPALVSTPPAAPDQATLLEGVRVLLAEDQPLNQELACELLQRVGASVVVAQDGRQALQALQDAPDGFDCVLMDCQMPHMDGYAATHLIRQEAQWQRLPIIAMTASALVSDRERALAAGMNDHISKPLDVQQMYQVIGRWVNVARHTLK